MVLEFLKLGMGLLIALFHRQIASYVREHERVLVGRLRQRGLMMPEIFAESTTRNIYFSLGIFVAAFEMVRILTLMRG
jgi:hypothetical protein